jgi:hypothetical protein
MTAMLSLLAATFAKFYGRNVLGEGLKALPEKVGPCLSHGKSADACR